MSTQVAPKLTMTTQEVHGVDLPVDTEATFKALRSTWASRMVDCGARIDLVRVMATGCARKGHRSQEGRGSVSERHNLATAWCGKESTRTTVLAAILVDKQSERARCDEFRTVLRRARRGDA